MNDVKKVLKEAIAKGWSLENGGKHFKLRHPCGALVIVSQSASDYRAALNIRGDLRRALRKK